MPISNPISETYMYVDLHVLTTPGF